MEKALRRQAGASDVDMDMEAGYAKVMLGTPAQIDVGGLAEDLDGAGYTLKTLEVEAQAEVVQGTCTSCGDVEFLELSDSGQRFEIEGEAPTADADGQVRAYFSGWETEHVRVRKAK